MYLLSYDMSCLILNDFTHTKTGFKAKDSMLFFSLNRLWNYLKFWIYIILNLYYNIVSQNFVWSLLIFSKFSKSVFFICFHWYLCEFLSNIQIKWSIWKYMTSRLQWYIVYCIYARFSIQKWEKNCGICGCWALNQLISSNTCDIHFKFWSWSYNWYIIV